MKSAAITPFDLILAVVLLVGVIRGRKRGISEELIDVIAWVTVVVASAFTYRHLGGLFANLSGLPIMWANLFAYLLVAVIVLFIFKSVKRAVGEKLVQGDTFGRFEYYLGMLAGALRFFCISMLILAIFNAKYSTEAERAATAKMQRDNFGSISFPTIESVQQSVFYESLSGKFIQNKLKMLLIEPVPPTTSSRETIGRRRERAVDEVLK